jgi:type VI secretion system protein ImpH
MLQSDGSHSLICNYDQDYKAETIAAELIGQGGADPEQVIICMLGSLKRTYSRDTRDTSVELPDDHKEYTVLNTHREGIYDMLPEGMFHHPTAHKSAQSEREIIDMMKKRRQEEINARKFFVPMEASINFLRIQMAMRENRLDKRVDYNDLIRLFEGHWEIFRHLDPKQANIFLHLIPIIHEIRDDHAMIEEVLEMIFPATARIDYIRQRPLHPADAMWSQLDENVLGVNLTTGNLAFDDGADELVLTLGPMEGDLYREFMPGRKNNIILGMLCDYLLPVNIDLTTKFELAENDKLARLEDISGYHNAVLGEDMVLI